MACLFCGQDLTAKPKYSRRMLTSCSPDIVSLWKELIIEYVDGDLDSYVDCGVVCHNCCQKCNTYLKHKEQRLLTLKLLDKS